MNSLIIGCKQISSQLSERVGRQQLGNKAEEEQIWKQVEDGDRPQIAPLTKMGHLKLSVHRMVLQMSIKMEGHGTGTGLDKLQLLEAEYKIQVEEKVDASNRAEDWLMQKTKGRGWKMMPSR
ncbi:hypothetical protein scyTo_0000916 [Scyliorhinus torazame]|uniref:Uncharacterized protein n=1 Tax=Scyliorhinus torazame TaxID=75743 RepID=A0A401P629_SCYTO|nr:hypothetical protein [Scyliorhinus torazame]